MKNKNLTSCPVCESYNCQSQQAYVCTHKTFRGQCLFLCADCGLVFSWPQPMPEQLAEYNRDFFNESIGGLPVQESAKLFFEGIALVRLSQIESFFSQGLPQSVLEIGPGSGVFCRHYLSKRSDARYTVVETDTLCQTILSQMGVYVKNDITELNENDSFDLLIMSHVLEHVIDPISFLSDAIAFLNNGGIVFIEVPCSDYQYKGMNEPHLLFFDKNSMHHLLTKVGLEDIKVGYYGEPIRRLKNEIGFLSKWRCRIENLRRKYKRIGPPPRDISPEIWHQIGPFEPLNEKSEPARWLRVFARMR